MKLILLVSVPDLGSQFDRIELPEKEAFDLLAKRQAKVLTPLTEKQFKGLGRDRTSSPTIR